MSEAIFSRIAQLGIVPVIAIEKADAAIPLADALLDGGLPVVEITFRTAAAAEVIRKISRERPELIVGAGTVLTVENLEAAKASGAAFAVAPGLNPEIVKHAQRVGLPFAPGIATPTDIELGLSLGCKYLKFFPAEANGGVNTTNLESYLKIETVAAVGGTWIAKKEDLASGNWGEIRRRCKAALEIAAKARPKK